VQIDCITLHNMGVVVPLAARHGSPIHHAAILGSTLQHTATHYTTLQHDDGR